MVPGEGCLGERAWTASTSREAASANVKETEKKDFCRDLVCEHYKTGIPNNIHI